MAGNKQRRAGKGKVAPKQARAKVVAKAKTARKGKGKRVAKPKPAAKGKVKAAPKKAAPKKAAAKKAAAKKAAPKKAAPKKAAPKKHATPTAIAAKPTAMHSPPAAGSGALLETEILAMARQVYGDRSDAQLLALDPNEVDEIDPATFYEMIAEGYDIEADPASSNFGGFGGPIKNLIEFVGARWDGKTRREGPMPPKEWLDEFVHPATERVPSQEEPQDEPLLD